MKITVVGGASTYTPELIDGFARMHSVMPIDEVVLVDPAVSRLETIGKVSQRMLNHVGRPYELSLQHDLAKGVEGADVVLIQLRVGGQATRDVDERTPLDLGCIGQETTGFGGLAKALRTVPVVLQVADVVTRYAPDAWIVDFTNPVGIVTRALLDSGHRAVGLCNVAIGLQHFFARLMEVEPERVSLSHVGLNHLSWELEVLRDGTDVLPDLLHSHGEEIAQRVKLPPGVVQRLGMVPSYYLRYFYCHDTVLRDQRSGGSRAREVIEIERELLTLYEDPSIVTKPEALSHRGGALYSEAAVQLMASLVGDKPGEHVVNRRNDGLMPFLPDTAVIEVPAKVDKGTIHLLPTPAVPAIARGLIADVSAYEELAVAAACRPTRRAVVTALMAHPLIRQWEVAETLADRLLKANAEYLDLSR